MVVYRKTWWLTRPVRAPIAHDLAVKTFAEVAEGKRWEGNRNLHLQFEKKLGEIGIKRRAVSTVGAGSGGRTWASLLRAFGFWYPSEIDGKVILTPVAKAIIKGIKVKDHIIKQILNYQIPNAYFISKEFIVKPHPDFKIFPFRFLLKMLLDPEIKYLTEDEIAIFVITAKKDEDLPRLKNTILKYRALSERDGKELKDRVDLITQIQRSYDHRYRKNAHLDYKGYLDFTRAIAHTFVINLAYIDGIRKEKSKVTINSKKEKEIGRLLDFYEKMYPFNQLYKISEEAFSGHYGLELGKFKYTRKIGVPPVASLLRKASKKITLAVNELLSINPILEKGEKLIEILHEKTGLDDNLIRVVLEKEHPTLLFPTLPSVSQQFLERYLSVATDGTKWEEFEEMTRKIFRELGYAVLPKLSTKEGEQIDALLLDKTTKHSAILDAKSGELYSLTTKDRDLMGSTYIPNFLSYQAIDGTYNLCFFIYVVGKKFRGEKNLRKIYAKSGVRGSALNARQLLLILDLSRKKKISLDKLEKLFTLTKLLTDKDILTCIDVC
jgi:hypothetical protein